MDEILEGFISELKNQFGSHLQRTLLFGSRARGDATRESDYDLLLIFDSIDKEKVDRVESLEDRWLLEHGAVFSAVCLDETRLAKRRFEPFLMNAQREGIRL